MKMKKKHIFLIAALTIIAAVVAVYFVFPETAFKLLLKTERSSAGLKQYSIDVEGFRIEYLEGGRGDVVLLLHGFGANKDNLISLWLIAPGGVATADPSEMAKTLNAGKPNPLIVESAEDYQRLLDFIFVKKPFIPPPLLNQLAKDAIRNRSINQIIEWTHKGKNSFYISMIR
jgi:hypothetical protein